MCTSWSNSPLAKPLSLDQCVSLPTLRRCFWRDCEAVSHRFGKPFQIPLEHTTAWPTEVIENSAGDLNACIHRANNSHNMSQSHWRFIYWNWGSTPSSKSERSTMSSPYSCSRAPGHWRHTGRWALYWRKADARVLAKFRALGQSTLHVPWSLVEGCNKTQQYLVFNCAKWYRSMDPTILSRHVKTI